MKINLDKILLSVDDSPLKRGAESDDEVTLGYALAFACLNADPRKHDTGEKKYKIYKILKKVSGEGKVNLKTEEVALLKTLVGEVSPVNVVGAVYDILEGVDEEEATES